MSTTKAVKVDLRPLTDLIRDKGVSALENLASDPTHIEFRSGWHVLVTDGQPMTLTLAARPDYMQEGVFLLDVNIGGGHAVRFMEQHSAVLKDGILSLLNGAGWQLSEPFACGVGKYSYTFWLRKGAQ